MIHSAFDTLHPEPPPYGFDPVEIPPRPLGDGPFRISSLALDPAGECNLRCRYCAEHHTQPPRPPMVPETLERAWHFLFPDGIPRMQTSFRLGSGEPTLALPLLRRLADRTRAWGSSAPAVFLTTNGTLLNEASATWLEATGWFVKLSIDGPARTHDAWRTHPDGTGTHATVVPWARRFARRIPERFSITAVLCKGADPQAVFASLEDLGARRIELVPAASNDPEQRPGQEDVVRYQAFVFRHAERFLTTRKRMPSLVRFSGKVTKAMGYNNLTVACGAGRTFLGVGPGGDLYPCFRFVGSDRHRLGSLEEGLDPTSCIQFQRDVGRPYTARLVCGACWASPLCGGPCFACETFFGDSVNQGVHCAYTRADARAAVWLVQELRHRAPKRLLAFMPEIQGLG